MPIMAKKKPKSSEDARVRQAIFLEPEWHEVVRKLAGKAEKPLKWYIIKLLIPEAEKAGIEVPAAPWETEPDLG